MGWTAFRTLGSVLSYTVRGLYVRRRQSTSLSRGRSVGTSSSSVHSHILTVEPKCLLQPWVYWSRVGSLGDICQRYVRMSKDVRIDSHKSPTPSFESDLSPIRPGGFSLKVVYSPSSVTYWYGRRSRESPRDFKRGVSESPPGAR